MGALHTFVNNFYPELTKELADDIDSIEVIANLNGYHLRYAVPEKGQVKGTVHFSKEIPSFAVAFENDKIMVIAYSSAHQRIIQNTFGRVVSSYIDVVTMIDLVKKLL